MTALYEIIGWAAAWVVLLAATALFSGMVAALVAIHRFRLRYGAPHQGLAIVRRILALAEETQRIQFVAVIASTLTGAGLAVSAILLTQSVAAFLAAPPDWRVYAAALAATFLALLILAEIVPQRLFRRAGNRAIVRMFYPIRWSLFLFGILADALIQMAQLLSLAVGRFKTLPPDVLVPAEPWQSLLETEPAVSPAAEAADAAERRMIHAVLDLERTRAREAMRPIADLIVVHLPESVGAVRQLARQTGYSRFPVYRDRVINLCGYLDIYDILAAEPPDNLSAESFVREPYFVPETTRLDALLRDLLQGRHKIAIAVDEFGACSGWVTREDLLEEIVGEIEDEFDEGHEPLRRESDRAWHVQASVRIDHLNRQTGLHLPSEDFDTVGGFVYDRLGRIPQTGDSFDDGGVRFEVLEMDNRRIVALRATLPAENGEP